MSIQDHIETEVLDVARKRLVADMPNPCCKSVLDAPLDEAQAEELAHAFGALADPVRLRLLSLIATAGPVCACDLLQPLDRSQPTVSHHTKALAEAGLIVGERRGRWVWWSIVPERVAGVRNALGAADLAGAAAPSGGP